MKVRNIPKYRKHHQANHAFVEWNGTRWQLPGEFDSAESREAYQQFVTSIVTAACWAPPWQIDPENRPGAGNGHARLTVADVALAYLEFAQTYYPEGTRSEFHNLKHALTPLLAAHASTPIDDFGPRDLKALQRSLAAKKKLRTGINATIGRIKRMFRWAASEEILPAAVYQRLATVDGIRRGRTPAKEPRPRQPVAWEHVAAILDELPPTVRDAVLVMWHTGARTGSIRYARADQFKTDVQPWEWRPRHKNEFRGRELVIFVGPKCQAILRAYLEQAADGGVLFSPRRSRRNPIYRPRYGPASIANSIRRAIDRVNVHRPEGEKIPYWSPHQLRHARGDRARQRDGLEAAQAVLGHDSIDATQLYAGRRDELAKRIAMEDG